jgi:hypothetical protein
MVDAVLSASRVLGGQSLAPFPGRRRALEEVTLTQYRSLVVLASRGPQGVAALADAVAVTPPTASRSGRPAWSRRDWCAAERIVMTAVRCASR